MRRPLRDWLPLQRFIVQDTSMRPALQPSDRLLVGGWLRPRRGGARNTIGNSPDSRRGGAVAVRQVPFELELKSVGERTCEGVKMAGGGCAA